MENVWDRLRVDLEDRIGANNVSTWFGKGSFHGIDRDRMLFRFPNRFFVEHVQNNYRDALVESVRTVTHGTVSEVQLDVNPSPQQELFPTASPPRRDEADERKPRVRPKLGKLGEKYTFENFVVGKSNDFAHAAARGAAERPGEKFNPLFIYGGVGLGKTHLINAIGHFVLGRDESAKVGYLSAEAFMNDLINAIQKQRMDEFKARFRKLDLLILDDVQFLAGKDRSQEEFFHTFNVLYDSRRQIVLTSDRTPKEISNLEDRLRSRFEQGLIADIKPPDMETRIAILRKKAEAERIELDRDVTFFLAEKFTANIRELEGALTSLCAHASLAGKPISLAFAREKLRNLVSERKFHVTPEIVQEVVAEEYKVRPSDLRSSRRTQNFVLPRQVAMFLCQKLAGASLTTIGEKFGKRDHSTVHHSIRVINNRLKEDASLQMTLARLESLIERQVRP